MKHRRHLIATASLIAIPLLGMTCQGRRPDPPAAASEQAGPTGSRIVIGTEQYDQTVFARLNDIVVVNLSRTGSGWRVEFDHNVLEHLGPAGSIESPGTVGWSFRCVGAGISELVFTAPTASCPAGTVCPPAQFEFRTRVDVRK